MNPKLDPSTLTELKTFVLWGLSEYCDATRMLWDKSLCIELVIPLKVEVGVFDLRNACVYQKGRKERADQYTLS